MAYDPNEIIEDEIARGVKPILSLPTNYLGVPNFNPLAFAMAEMNRGAKPIITVSLTTDYVDGEYARAQGDYAKAQGDVLAPYVTFAGTMTAINADLALGSSSKIGIVGTDLLAGANSKIKIAADNLGAYTTAVANLGPISTVATDLNLGSGSFIRRAPDAGANAVASATAAAMSANTAVAAKDAVIAALNGQSVTTPITLSATDKAALAAYSVPAGGALAYLTNSGLAGMVSYITGDQSARIVADPYKALNIPPASSPTGGAGVWARPITQRVYEASWTGMTTADQDCHIPMNSLLAQMEPGSKLRVRAGEYGVAGKITVPRYISIEGEGKGSTGFVARTATKNFHVLHCRYGDNTISDLYAGGVKGNLTVGEAAAFHSYPGEISQGGTVTDDIQNIIWRNLRATDCETGFRMGYNVTNVDGSGQVRRTKNSAMEYCDSDGVLSHNVELFQSDNITVLGGNHAMIDGAWADPPKMIRLIGCRSPTIIAPRLMGPGTNSNYRGIYIELAAPYSKYQYWRYPADITIIAPDISGCPTPFYVNGSQGDVNWVGGRVRGVPGITTYGVRVNTPSYLIQPQTVRSTPPVDPELGIKYSSERVSVSGVRMQDVHEIARWGGKMDLLDISDIVNVAGSTNMAGKYAFNSEAGTSAADVYRVRLKNIRDYAVRDVTTALRITGGQTGSSVEIDDCELAYVNNVSVGLPWSRTGSGAANVAVSSSDLNRVRRIDPALAQLVIDSRITKDSA